MLRFRVPLSFVSKVRMRPGSYCALASARECCLFLVFGMLMSRYLVRRRLPGDAECRAEGCSRSARGPRGFRVRSWQPEAVRSGTAREVHAAIPFRLCLFAPVCRPRWPARTRTVSCRTAACRAWTCPGENSERVSRGAMRSVSSSLLQSLHALDLPRGLTGVEAETL